MSAVEDLLIRTLRDPARELPVAADPVPAIRHRARAQRRNTALGLAAVVLVVAATLVVPAATGRFTRPAPVATDPAPQGSGLLEWPASGPLAGDAALVRDAIDRWAGRPAGKIRLVWAGRVRADRVVLLQSAAADGTAALAEVADRAGTLTLLGTEPIRDPGVDVLRLVDPAGPAARTLVLSRPGGVTVRVLLGSGVSQPVPAGGVVELPGELAGQAVAVLDRDGRVLGDGDLPRPGGFAVTRGDVRLTAAAWDSGAVRPPGADDYAGGEVLGRTLDPSGTEPVEVSVIAADSAVDLRSGRPADPRFYEVHRAGRTYLGWIVWIGGRPFCPHLDDVTDSGGQADALVLRCALPQDRTGLVYVLPHNGLRLSGLRITAARPGEKTVAFELALPRDGGLPVEVDALPTGPGTVRLEDGAGDARPPISLLPYRP